MGDIESGGTKKKESIFPFTFLIKKKKNPYKEYSAVTVSSAKGDTELERTQIFSKA